MFYPAYLNLHNRECLVVGGGTVAERKVVTMLLSDANVTVISPEVTELVQYLSEIGSIHWHKRQLEKGDVQGYFLVCAATDDTNINTTVFTEAHDELNIRLVNVVDVIPQCTFAAASVVTDGDIVISISTSGKSPATSRRIREHLEQKLNASSMYTLGYENGKPTPIQRIGLPYPCNLLLENRECVILTERDTPEVKRRLSLLQQCGAEVLYQKPESVEFQDIADTFLVISEKQILSDIVKKNKVGFLYECLDQPESGTFLTPNVILDDNLVISIAAKNGTDNQKENRLYEELTIQFENNRYGEFLDILGSYRSQVLETFQISKRRGDFFESIIGYVGDKSKMETCCLGFNNLECSAECIFNWVRKGRIEQAEDYISTQLQIQKSTN